MKDQYIVVLPDYVAEPGEAPFTGAVNQGFAAVRPSTADSASVRLQDTLTVAVPEVSLPALSLTVPATAWFAPSVLTV